MLRCESETLLQRLSGFCTAPVLVTQCQKPYTKLIFFSFLLLKKNIVPKTTRSTCSRLPSHWMLRRTAARMLPSMPKARWLTSSTGSKSRTMWRTSWPTPPAWSRTRNASSPVATPTAVPQLLPPASWHASACWACSAY